MKRLGFFSRAEGADIPADPEEAAAYWSARRHLGTMTPATIEAFEAWLAEPAHRAAFESAEDFVDSVGAFASQPKIRHMREAALAAGPDHLLAGRRRGAFLRTAAALLVLGLFATIIGVSVVAINACSSFNL